MVTFFRFVFICGIRGGFTGHEFHENVQSNLLTLTHGLIDYFVAGGFL
jgi:hypothetical protein